MATEALPLEGVIGFGGSVRNGLILHPDGSTLIYPLGSTIVIREKGKPTSQEFLQGHSDKVSCLAISNSGRYLASGQITYMGFCADIIIWDMETRKLLHRMSLHKVKVQALAFSHDDQYLASIGGQDDNSLVVWDVASGAAKCGSPTSSESVICVKFFNNNNQKIVTAGSRNMDVWTFDPINRKVRPLACHLGQLKRVMETVVIDEADEFAYCGTSTGDVLQVNMKNNLFNELGPKSKSKADNFSQGVLASAITPFSDVLLGAGDGTISLLRKDMQVKCQAKLPSGITSIVLTNDVFTEGPHAGSFAFLCGTHMCDMYYVRYLASENRFICELEQTNHFEQINDIAFPADYSALFATASSCEIRIWHATEYRELLRIQVPNLMCNCIHFMADGKSIISGWSDGKIRAFGPQSGKLLYTIHNAHQQAVTAVIGTHDCKRVMSGGQEGLVRVWRIGPQSQSMVASMKEHKGPVNALELRKNDSECVSASSDGSCIIWDLNRFTRSNSLFASTFFKGVLYHPDESQLVTTGTDRKITYWDAFDGQAIRILDGSDTAALEALAISEDGETLVSGGVDKDVKVWGYDEGHCYFVGRGHSGTVTKVKISPNMKYIVSCGSEGAIFIWEYIHPTMEA
jgi:WD40 repeat protein